MNVERIKRMYEKIIPLGIIITFSFLALGQVLGDPSKIFAKIFVIFVFLFIMAPSILWIVALAIHQKREWEKTVSQMVIDKAKNKRKRIVRIIYLPVITFFSALLVISGWVDGRILGIGIGLLQTIFAFTMYYLMHRDRVNILQFTLLYFPTLLAAIILIETIFPI